MNTFIHKTRSSDRDIYSSEHILITIYIYYKSIFTDFIDNDGSRGFLSDFYTVSTALKLEERGTVCLFGCPGLVCILRHYLNFYHLKFI